MARGRRRRAARKTIVFILTAAQKKELLKKGLLKNNAGNWVRARYRNGRLIVSRHLTRGGKVVTRKGKFVASNAAFA